MFKKIIFVVLITASISCSKDEITPLNEQEKKDLIYLREEEKLAKDVYLYAYSKYQNDIFLNIAKSEEKHIAAVLKLYDKFGIYDNANQQSGLYNNQELQIIYTTLIEKIDISLIEALKVGATIEDLDIKDINDLISHTSNTNLLKVYGNLVCGSRNHIRSFTNLLNENNESYTPQFITNDYYFEILNTSNENCGNN
jgi:hypothetical protein